MAMSNKEKQEKHREKIRLAAEAAQAEISRLKAESEIIPKLKAEVQNLKRENQKLLAETANIKNHNANSLKIAWTRGVLDVAFELSHFIFSIGGRSLSGNTNPMKFAGQLNSRALDNLSIKQSDAREAAAAYFDWCPQGPQEKLDVDQFYDEKGRVLTK